MNTLPNLNVKKEMKCARTFSIHTEHDLIEILVGYTAEIIYDVQLVDFHGMKVVNDTTVNIELTSCEVVFAGHGVDCLPQMTKQMKEWIIKQLPNE